MRVRREAMTTSTQCPQCNTRFKITQEQLDAHQGLVRCGCCQAVFNAAEQLQNDQPSPQLALPIVAEEIQPAPISTVHEEPDFIHIKSPEEPFAPAEPITQATKILFAHDPAEPPAKKSIWPWALGSVSLLMLLLGQVAYFYRVELAANLPGLRPALTAYCGLLHCTVPLPQKADLMSIESSDLEADPTQASVITLNALLRNRAPHVQAYPNLELTLTDAQDKALARRTFLPTEYLKPDDDEKQGLAANHELSVKLNLDTADLKASGYRLFLFYPQ
ncbi:MAG: zinc-ribbon domain-containing protein [Nitrosomonadales bacterium]|nr:zinc-ribbon domain-containing protein [Nitrosomonadales bacterium]